MIANGPLVGDGYTNAHIVYMQMCFVAKVALSHKQYCFQTLHNVVNSIPNYTCKMIWHSWSQCGYVCIRDRSNIPYDTF